jgi:hypothetical protein
MLWKSRWTGDWFLRRAADQPRRARTQDNQILISAYDEIQTRRLVTTASSLVNVPSPSSQSNMENICMRKRSDDAGSMDLIALPVNNRKVTGFI